MKTVQALSWLVTLFFLVALAWAIYQAIFNGNPLPIWAWVGVAALLAVAIGLAIAVVVYRGVAKQVGPFDFQSTSHPVGEIRNEARYVEAIGASSLKADIEMLEGILRISDGATEVMDGGFSFDSADWKEPIVEYSVNDAGLGNLLMKQQATGRAAMRQGHCEWTIRLSQDLPMDLQVKIGAGEAHLDLVGIRLSRLRVEGGVGKLELDLRGEWKQSLDAFVKTGIGDAVLRLPKNVGVHIQSTVGFGSIHPNGLSRDGDDYINEQYGKSPVTLNIIIEGGIGKISLE